MLDISRVNAHRFVPCSRQGSARFCLNEVKALLIVRAVAAPAGHARRREAITLADARYLLFPTTGFGGISVARRAATGGRSQVGPQSFMSRKRTDYSPAVSGRCILPICGPRIFPSFNAAPRLPGHVPGGGAGQIATDASPVGGRERHGGQFWGMHHDLGTSSAGPEGRCHRATARCRSQDGP